MNDVLRGASKRDDGQMPAVAERQDVQDSRPAAALPAAGKGDLVVHWVSENFL